VVGGDDALAVKQGFPRYGLFDGPLQGQGAAHGVEDGQDAGAVFKRLLDPGQQGLWLGEVGEAFDRYRLSLLGRGGKGDLFARAIGQSGIGCFDCHSQFGFALFFAGGLEKVLTRYCAQRCGEQQGMTGPKVVAQ
jgi:hypothetical protein